MKLVWVIRWKDMEGWQYHPESFASIVKAAVTEAAKKDIIELCDQDGLVTYTYLENMNPVIVHGNTSLGGKLTFLGQTIGYGIPYATQFTSPQRIAKHAK